MTQTVIVILIVVATVAFAVRGFVRIIKGKRECNCRCGHQRPTNSTCDKYCNRCIRKDAHAHNETNDI